MSGITGIFRLDGIPVSGEVLQRMTDALAHRGPDGCGCWSDGQIGLGHTLFCTTPESVHERQPVVDAAAGLALVWDGRIDNREELCASLGLKTTEFTDPQLALVAYQRWGADSLPKIVGDFALAVWDRNARRLLCARDVIGQRPLYYWFDGKTFLFASEFQPLFEFPGVPREPNLQQAARWLVHGMAAEDDTLYEDIFRVRSAQALLVDCRGLTKVCYWEPDPEKKTRYRKDEDYAEHFGSLFREAVRCRMRATGTVGVLVSGGLDSTSIACVVQKLRNEGAVENGVQTFSTIYDTLPCDEREYVHSAVDKWRLDATLNVYEKHPEWRDFGLMARFPDSLYSPTDHIQEFSQMRDRGIRVYFDGIGGDELLAPDLDCITEGLRHLRFFRAWQQLRVASTTYGSSLSRFGVMYCVAPFVPTALKRLVRPLVRRSNAATNHMVRKQYADSATQHVSRKDAKFAEVGAQSAFESFYAGSTPMAVDLQELLACRFPLECRRPFADRRLLEYRLSIPDDLVWRPGQPIKTILREAMRGVLPEKVRCRRDEAEFSPLLDHEVRQRQRNEVDQLIRDSHLVKLGVVNQKELSDLWEGYCNGSKRFGLSVLMYAIGWELWYRCSIFRNIDKRERHG